MIRTGAANGYRLDVRPELRAATSAATGESLETEADLVVSLRVAGWGVDVRPDRPDGRGWATRADRRRYVARTAGRTVGRVGEWYVQGDGLDANASGATRSELLETKKRVLTWLSPGQDPRFSFC